MSTAVPRRHRGRNARRATRRCRRSSSSTAASSSPTRTPGLPPTRRRTFPARAMRISIAISRAAPAPDEGRHPLPTPERSRTARRVGHLEREFRRAYDGGSGALAARLWWMLRWLGHERAAVLNGGFAPLATPRAPDEQRSEQPRRRASLPDHGPTTGWSTPRTSPPARAATACSSTCAAPDRFTRRARADRSCGGPCPGRRQRAFHGDVGADGRLRRPRSCGRGSTACSRAAIRPSSSRCVAPA